jgi:DNA-binding PadR family transcriptional regulator
MISSVHSLYLQKEAGVTSSKRNMYRIIEGLVDRKLLQAEYTKAIPRERMIRISDSGKKVLDSVRSFLQSIDLPDDLVTTQFIPEKIPIRKKIRTNEIEQLITAEIFDDSDDLDTETLRKIKKAAKSIINKISI